MSLTRPARTPTPTPSPRPRGLRGLIAGHPVTAFLVLAFSLIYPLMSLPILASRDLIPGKQLLEALPIAPDEVAGFLLTLGGLLPATLIVIWCADGRDGVRRLFGRVLRWRVGIGWWLVVLTALPALTTGLALLMGDPLKPVDPVGLFVRQLGLLAANLLLVNLWEETAWAGFLQTRLERRHNLLVAALITAVPFGFAHLPLALFGDVTAGSLLVSLVAYIALGVFVRPLIGVVLRGTRDSVLAVAVLHSVFNRTNNDNGIAAELLTGEARKLTMLIAVAVLAAATALVVRRRLTRAYRLELDAAGAAPTAAPYAAPSGRGR